MPWYFLNVTFWPLAIVPMVWADKKWPLNQPVGNENGDKNGDKNGDERWQKLTSHHLS